MAVEVITSLLQIRIINPNSTILTITTLVDLRPSNIAKAPLTMARPQTTSITKCTNQTVEITEADRLPATITITKGRQTATNIKAVHRQVIRLIISNSVEVPHLAAVDRPQATILTTTFSNSIDLVNTIINKMTMAIIGNRSSNNLLQVDMTITIKEALLRIITTTLEDHRIVVSLCLNSKTTSSNSSKEVHLKFRFLRRR